jgi:hypothetical protein
MPTTSCTDFMARYTRYLSLSIPIDQFYPQLTRTLESCNLRVLHTSWEYIMASEDPGMVPLSQLVKVEVFVDNNRTTAEDVNLTLVVKNEELPLRANNHCQQMFQEVNNALAKNRSWELSETVSGLTP